MTVPTATTTTPARPAKPAVKPKRAATVKPAAEPDPDPTAPRSRIETMALPGGSWGLVIHGPDAVMLNELEKREMREATGAVFVLCASHWVDVWGVIASGSDERLIDAMSRSGTVLGGRIRSALGMLGGDDEATVRQAASLAAQAERLEGECRTLAGALIEIRAVVQGANDPDDMRETVRTMLDGTIGSSGKSFPVPESWTGPGAQWLKV